MHRRPENLEPSPARLTKWNLLSFGLGGLPYHLGVNALKHLSYPVFNVLLGVNPWLIGSLHMLVRLWDAFLDPVLGSWPDRC